MDPVERLQIIDTLKKRTRKNNWNYLCRHKEVRAIIRVILNEVIKQQPDNIYNFIASLFHCDNMEIVTKEVNAQIKRVSNLIKNSAWTEYDGEMFFSNTSMGRNNNSAIDAILKYTMAEEDVQKEDANSEVELSESIEISVNKLSNV